MRSCLSACSPAKSHIIHVHICRPGTWYRLTCQNRYVGEADLTETLLRDNAAPVAIGSYLDVFRYHAAEINRGIGWQTGRTSTPGKFEVTQCRPVAAISRILNGGIFDAETENRLKGGIIVPYPHLTQFINLVELMLDPGRVRIDSTTEPHIHPFRRVKVIRIQAGAVDGIFRPFVCAVGAGSGGGDILRRHGISERLDRKLPDLAFMDRKVRGWADLIDTPAVSLAELENFSRTIAGRILVLTYQHTQWVISGSIVDIVKIAAEIYVVFLDTLARCPAKRYVPLHTCCSVGWPQVGGFR